LVVSRALTRRDSVASCLQSRMEEGCCAPGIVLDGQHLVSGSAPIPCHIAQLVAPREGCLAQLVLPRCWCLVLLVA
ncbi:hypothetical protein HAX54_008737, partial [Datura stramonium]|nr:hypothetical protein [Datura stramonium]